MNLKSIVLAPWWPGFVMLAGVALSLFIGLLSPLRKRIASPAATTGLITNLLSQAPEGGPGLCFGMLLMPLWCILVAYLGRGLRLILVRCDVIEEPAQPVGPSCPGCGYCLIGLAEHVCPECGRPFTLEELDVTERQLRPPDPP
jgi:hypothetical protein